MTIDKQLFEGKKIRLGPIDHDKDSQVESRWTHDITYLQALGMDVPRPVSSARMKKKYEEIEKQVETSKNNFYFTIRQHEKDNLVGFVQFYWIEWSHGMGNLRMGVGEPSERNKGYGSEALSLALRYAFDELNLFRMGVTVGEDNPRAIQFFKRFGFVEEVRRRQALHRDDRYWDLIHLGLLAEEWRQLGSEVGQS